MLEISVIRDKRIMKSSLYKTAMLGTLLACLCALQARGYEAGSSQRELRSLSGHVISSESAPLYKAVVYLKDTKTLAIKTYISDADGSFRFPALSPNVDYEVYAEYQGGHSDTKTISAFDNRKQVNVTLKIRSKK